MKLSSGIQCSDSFHSYSVIHTDRLESRAEFDNALQHFCRGAVSKDASPAEFEKIASMYPVFRVENIEGPIFTVKPLDEGTWVDFDFWFHRYNNIIQAPPP